MSVQVKAAILMSVILVLLPLSSSDGKVIALGNMKLMRLINQTNNALHILQVTCYGIPQPDHCIISGTDITQKKSPEAPSSTIGTCSVTTYAEERKVQSFGNYLESIEDSAGITSIYTINFDRGWVSIRLKDDSGTSPLDKFTEYAAWDKQGQGLLKCGNLELGEFF